ncbi:MAG: cytochrome-c peroxidase [Flavobacteriales bacterium]|nr:cytochrome-c peroxidase [Flavobacteriales bacterium]
MARGMFKPLPASSENPDNPITKEKVKLGQVLYFDKRLSLDGTQSCNTCHNLATFGVDNLATSPGDAGKNGDRNSPTSLNAALHTTQFWDGRAKDVEEQAGMPITNPVEMAIPNEDFLVKRLKDIDLYQKLFAAAYPDDKAPVSYLNLKKAIGAFERQLLAPSKWDSYLGGHANALSLAEKKGLQTFINVGCTSCHGGELLGGNMFQKFGVHHDYWEHTKSVKVDEGRFTVTGLDADKYMFKVPSLRNVAKTAPYFHDGSVADLNSAVKIIAKVNLNKDLTDDEVKNIVTFLEALTGELPVELTQEPLELL